MNVEFQGDKYNFESVTYHLVNDYLEKSRCGRIGFFFIYLYFRDFMIFLGIIW